MLLSLLDQLAQVVAGEIERYLLAKEDFQAILAFGGVAAAVVAAASAHGGVAHAGAHGLFWFCLFTLCSVQ